MCRYLIYEYCEDNEDIVWLTTMQMTARRERRTDEDVQLRLELEEERRAEEDYDEMLRQEAERMSVRDFQPKVGGYFTHSLTR